MRRFVVLILVLLLVLPGVVLAESEEIVITYGKEFDFDGKTFLDGQDLENNYYTDYVYEQHKVRVKYEWVLDDDAQKDSLAVINGAMGLE